MEKVVTASEADRRFFALLRDVAAGQSFTVTSRGVPIARVVPVDRQQESLSVR